MRENNYLKNQKEGERERGRQREGDRERGSES